MIAENHSKIGSVDVWYHEKLREENNRLRKALKRYGSHDEECGLVLHGWKPCSCGLKQAQKGE